MASESYQNSFPLHSVDRHGNHIAPAVLAAAEAILPRALEHGRKVLGDDPAVVANALEEVAAAVSRRIANKDGAGDATPIRNLAGYIFRAFERHVKRLKNKELVLVSDNDGQPLTSGWTDASRQFETKILVDECLAKCDFATRDMFLRRVQGCTWEEIGKIHGISGHAAEVRFQNAIRGIRAQLANGRRPLPSTTRANRTGEVRRAMKTDVEEQDEQA